MRSPDEVAAGRRRGSWLTRLLAVVGALALVLCLAAAVGFFLFARPKTVDTPAEATSPTQATPSAPATTPGDLQTDDTWSPDLDLQTEKLLTHGIELRDVKVQGQGARTTENGEMHVERLRVNALVPFDAVERQVGRGVRLAPSENGLVRATLPLSVLGRSFDVAVDAQVVPDGDGIAIEPVRVVDAGVVGDALQHIPAMRAPVPDLPEGVRLEKIDVEDQGFRIEATGENVTLRQ